ncbi:MAG: ROK family protein [Mycobacteriaceae bacterium]
MSAEEVLTIGIDVGGTSIRAGLVSDGTVLDTVETATRSSVEDLEQDLTRVVAELRSRHPVAAVGLAVAGFLTRDRTVVMFAPHLPWRQAPVAARMASLLGLPVVLEHDVNAAAWAEHRFGTARDCGVVAVVALGTGIGAALLVDGVLFRGAHGVAPELGHLRLVPDGRPCPCGGRGCWERYCSGTALVSTALELMAVDPGSSTRLHTGPALEPLTGRQVMAAARDGDPVALAAVADLAAWLGRGLALVADVYDPDVIVVGGGVAESASLFLPAAAERYARELTGAGRRPLARISPAALGRTAGLIGAAELARGALT